MAFPDTMGIPEQSFGSKKKTGMPGDTVGIPPMQPGGNMTPPISPGGAGGNMPDPRQPAPPITGGGAPPQVPQQPQRPQPPPPPQQTPNTARFTGASPQSPPTVRMPQPPPPPGQQATTQRWRDAMQQGASPDQYRKAQGQRPSPQQAGQRKFFSGGGANAGY